MNRAEKRRIDRTEKWFDSLTEDKKQIIYGIINEKIDSNNNMMTAISDICTVCALDDILDIDISKIRDVISRIKFYLVDYGEYLEKEGNGGITMIESKEVRDKVKTKIREYIRGKMDKARGLKLLKREFNLPYGELSDLWIECKNGDYPKNTDKVPEHEEQNTESKSETAADQDKIISKEIEPEKIVGPEKKSSLRVIKVTTEVQGEYGTYIKSIDGVKIGNALYKNKDVVKREKDEVSIEYKTKLDAIKEKIEDLNKQFKELQDSGMKEIERFTEIESVFDL